MVINPCFPNTALSQDILHKNIILCCGEDCAELLAARKDVTGAAPRQPDHDYRCYRFWKEPFFTLVWSGIGTGCLEPLLYEIFQSYAVDRIVLIGSSGLTGRRPVPIGEALLITEAWVGGAAVSLNNEQLPLRPRLSFPSSLTLPSASIVSSDFYYGFYQGDDSNRLRLRDALPSLRRDVLQVYQQVDLVDMESAQFYWLCNILGRESTAFAAIKGAANAVEEPSKQMLHAPGVLENCLRAALQLMV